MPTSTFCKRSFSSYEMGKFSSEHLFLDYPTSKKAFLPVRLPGVSEKQKKLYQRAQAITGGIHKL